MLCDYNAVGTTILSGYFYTFEDCIEMCRVRITGGLGIVRAFPMMYQHQGWPIVGPMMRQI
jgi:hypothetical protein